MEKEERERDSLTSLFASETDILEGENFKRKWKRKKERKVRRRRKEKGVQIKMALEKDLLPSSLFSSLLPLPEASFD